jgi:hypothetical protein
MRMLARRMRFLSQYLGLSVRSNMTCDRTALPVNTDANKNGFQPSVESSASFLLISSSVLEMSLILCVDCGTAAFEQRHIAPS